MTVAEDIAAAKADLELGLAGRLAGQRWGSPAMAKAIDAYLFRDLTRQSAAGVVASLAPVGPALQAIRAAATDLSMPAAKQIAVLRYLSSAELQEVVRRAWRRANRGVPAPAGDGYRSMWGEIALTALRRTGPR